MRSEMRKLGSVGNSGDPSSPPTPCGALPRDTQAGQHHGMHTSQDPVAPFSRGESPNKSLQVTLIESIV